MINQNYLRNMKWLLTCIILLAVAPLWAQRPRTIDEHRIIFGASDIKLTEVFILPASASGENLQLSYSFNRTGTKKKKSIFIQWNKAQFSARDLDVSLNGFTMAFSEAFSLLKSRRLSGYWGYSVRANPSFITARSEEGSVRHSWSTGNNLCLYQSLAYTSGIDLISLDIFVPVIGLSSRPGKTTSPHNTTNGLLYDSYSDLFFTSWHNLRAVSASLDFTRKINRRVAFTGGLQYQYTDLKDEYDYKERKLGLYAGISWVIY